VTVNNIQAVVRQATWTDYQERGSGTLASTILPDAATFHCPLGWFRIEKDGTVDHNVQLEVIVRIRTQFAEPRPWFADGQDQSSLFDRGSAQAVNVAPLGRDFKNYSRAFYESEAPTEVDEIAAHRGDFQFRSDDVVEQPPYPVPP